MITLSRDADITTLQELAETLVREIKSYQAEIDSLYPVGTSKHSYFNGLVAGRMTILSAIGYDYDN
jgi:hypothetical protein